MKKKVYYKLTDKNGRTHGGCQWGEGVEHKAKGKGVKLCSSAVIHCYSSPELAVFANPVHANFDLQTAQLWEFEVDRIVSRDTLKLGCKLGKTIRRIRMPKMSIDQRVEVAIRCALLAKQDPTFVSWANKWLSKEAGAAEAADWADGAADWAARAAKAAGAADVDIQAILEQVLKED